MTGKEFKENFDETVGEVQRSPTVFIHQSQREENRNHRGLSTAHLGLLMVAPVLIYLLFIQGYPVISAIFTSFTDKRIGVPGNFIGFENYIELIKDPIFRLALRNTFVITIISVTAKPSCCNRLYQYDGLILWTIEE